MITTTSVERVTGTRLRAGYVVPSAQPSAEARSGGSPRPLVASAAS